MQEHSARQIMRATWRNILRKSGREEGRDGGFVIQYFNVPIIVAGEPW